MKIMISGKGGSGKSTLTVLLARALAERGKRVLVIDADESNLCLPQLLGVEPPASLMDHLGGRAGTRERLKRATDHSHGDELFTEVMTIDQLPAECLAAAGGIRLLTVGKITRFGEGCACMIGGIAKTVLSRLREGADQLVLIDAEAGLEHFGRQVDRSCDLVLSVVEPSQESIRLAGRTGELARAAGLETYFLLNKVDDQLRELLTRGLDPARIIGVIPRSDELFVQSLKGEPLTVRLAELDGPCTFLTAYRKPLSLNLR